MVVKERECAKNFILKGISLLFCYSCKRMEAKWEMGRDRRPGLQERLIAGGRQAGGKVAGATSAQASLPAKARACLRAWNARRCEWLSLQ
jgi:hypothetical protein